MANSIPTIVSSKIEDPRLEAKVRQLDSIYHSRFNNSPRIFVRCPGRVNLIGEHVDYSKFPVLPIAIEQDLVAAIGNNSKDEICISSIDDITYPSKVCKFEAIPKPEDIERVEWYHYIMAGIHEISQQFALTPSFNILVYGTIPIAAGLSSSSALVCAGALGTAYMEGLFSSHGLGKKELSETCAVAEQYVGTKGGGMDHAIIFNAEKGFASKIEFYPELSVQNISLPKNVEFIVAHSGVRAEKAVSKIFNQRVIECKLAAKVLAKLLHADWRCVNNLGDLTRVVGKSPAEMVDLIETQGMLQEAYDGSEISKILEISLEKTEALLEGFQLDNTFKLQQRARHVFKECCNLENFIRACNENRSADLGQAMIQSHLSLSKDYECSHPSLEALVNCALNNCALGARLTGAGFGGCIVAAVDSTNAKTLLEKLQQLAIKNNLSPDTVFRTAPGQGAFIIENVT